MNNAAPEAVEPYPPFDIEMRADGTYRISVAVPGFLQDELEVVATEHAHRQRTKTRGRAPGRVPA